MRLHRSLLASFLSPLALLAALPASAAGGAASPVVVVAQADDKVEAARKALETAQQALDTAEDTGGDVRAARKSVANAMKSLRAAETAAGIPPKDGDAAPAPAPAPAPKAASPAPAPAKEPAAPAPAPAKEPPPAPAPAKEPSPAPADSPSAPKAYTPPKGSNPMTEPRNPAPKGSQGNAAPAPGAANPPAKKGAAPRDALTPTVVRRNGETETTYRQPDGVRIVEVTDRNGALVRRIRIDRDGNETVMFDRARPRQVPDSGYGGQRDMGEGEVPEMGGQGYGYGPRRGGYGYDDPRRMPPPYADPVVPPPVVPRGGFVNGDYASQAEIENALRGGPVVGMPRGYTLNEVRRDPRIREMVRRVDLDTITFDTGSARVPDDQVGKLQNIGRALQRILARRPNQVFLIEGHTDATGSAEANLQLSDRRAAGVASVLTRYFGVPPENLATQGYGEAYLKIPTDGPERQNRRVAIRNVTPLLGRGY